MDGSYMEETPQGEKEKSVSICSILLFTTKRQGSRNRWVDPRYPGEWQADIASRKLGKGGKM